MIQAITRYFAGEIARDVVLSLIAAYFSGDQVGTTPPPQLSDMIERVRPAVVKVIASGGLGSGAIYKTDSQYAYVVTNQHVIGSASTVTVKVEDATDYSGTVLGVDVARDLAVVRIACPGCAHIEFGDSQTLNLGDEVVALGYPLDTILPVAERETAARRIVPRSMSVTKGIVSAFRYDSEKDRQLVQTDTAINPGNSGGPLVSLDGKIMGINTFVYTAANIGFAVLETTVRGRLPTLEAGTSPAPTPVPSSSDLRLEPVFGPLMGHLHHDIDGRFESIDSFVWLKDVAALAWFKNPYAASGTKNFTHGFIMRSNRESHIRFYVHSSGQWWLQKWTRGARCCATIASGVLDNLRTGTEEWNRLDAVLLGNSGAFWVNGKLVTSATGGYVFSLGNDTGVGSVAIATEFTLETESFLEITNIGNFRVLEVLGGAALSGIGSLDEIGSQLTVSQEERPGPGEAVAEEAMH